MFWCLSNNGFSIRSVGQGYVAQTGEQLIPWSASLPTEEILQSLFPDRAAIVAENMLQTALENLASIRYAQECLGILFTPIESTSASLINSDPVSQGKVLSAYVMAQNNLWPTNGIWKCADGTYITLTETDVKNMATQMTVYVQNCYSNERALALSLQTDINTDLTQGWPSQSA